MTSVAAKADARTAAVALKIVASKESVGEGLLVSRALPKAELEAVGPFVFLDHMGPTQPPKGGVPAHPHAGIEVVTYLLQGENEHRDSLGNVSAVAAGGAQWLSAGRGMLHAEFPRGDANGVMQGVQLWARQPAALDEASGGYSAVAPGDIPQIDMGVAQLRLLVGEAEGFAAPGPIRLHSRALLIHASLEPGAEASLPLDEELELALYVLSGTGEIAGRALQQGELALLTRAAAVDLRNAGEKRLEALLLGGAPAERPLLFHGPFVFDTREKINRAYADYRAGRMGRLDGAPF